MKPIHLNNVHTTEISKQLISVTSLYADNKAFVEFYPTFFLTFHVGYLARWHDPRRPHGVFGEADRELG